MFPDTTLRAFSVIPGLVPGIHVFTAAPSFQTCMAGTSPAMMKPTD